jgi:hypothetical protein
MQAEGRGVCEAIEAARSEQIGGCRELAEASLVET